MTKMRTPGGNDIHGPYGPPAQENHTMKATKKLTVLLGGAAAISTIVALTAGAATSAASPAQSGATLYVCQDVGNPSNYRVSIKGVFPMQQPDAVGFLTHINDGKYPTGPGPGGMIYHVAGDDGNGWPGDRDILPSTFVPGAQVDGEGYVKAGPDGLEYLREISIPRKNFDEDNGLINDEDEIYAVAMFRDGDGGERHQSSQKIVRYFEVSGACDGCCQ
jgi:hypothetical protein